MIASRNNLNMTGAAIACAQTAIRSKEALAKQLKSAPRAVEIVKATLPLPGARPASLLR